jgi:hypothetical protein
MMPLLKVESANLIYDGVRSVRLTLLVRPSVGPFGNPAAPQEQRECSLAPVGFQRGVGNQVQIVRRNYGSQAASSIITRNDVQQHTLFYRMRTSCLTGSAIPAPTADYDSARSRMHSLSASAIWRQLRIVADYDGELVALRPRKDNGHSTRYRTRLIARRGHRFKELCPRLA